MKTTTEILESLKKVCEQVGDKPWDIEISRKGAYIKNLPSWQEGCVGGTDLFHYVDAEFISKARTAMPVLLDIVTRLHHGLATSCICKNRVVGFCEACEMRFDLEEKLRALNNG